VRRASLNPTKAIHHEDHEERHQDWFAQSEPKSIIPKSIINEVGSSGKHAAFAHILRALRVLRGESLLSHWG